MQVFRETCGYWVPVRQVFLMLVSIKLEWQEGLGTHAAGKGT